MSFRVIFVEAVNGVEEVTPVNLLKNVNPPSINGELIAARV